MSFDDNEHPLYLKLTPVAGFTSLAIADWAKNHLDANCRVLSDGLACFVAVTQAGCQHEAIIVFKLHAVINSNRELLAIKLTAGNVDDRKPVPELCQGLSGQLYADKGYIAQWLTDCSHRPTCPTYHHLKKNMKPVLRTDFEKALLQRRSLIETVFDQLKNLCQIEHSRHRSVANFVVNLIAGIVAYSLVDNKPSVDLAFSCAAE